MRYTSRRNRRSGGLFCIGSFPGVFLFLSYLSAGGCGHNTTRPYMEACGVCLQLESNSRNNITWYLKLWDLSSSTYQSALSEDAASFFETPPALDNPDWDHLADFLQFCCAIDEMPHLDSMDYVRRLFLWVTVGDLAYNIFGADWSNTKNAPYHDETLSYDDIVTFSSSSRIGRTQHPIQTIPSYPNTNIIHHPREKRKTIERNNLRECHLDSKYEARLL